MSAVVCGKRSSSFFADERLPPSPPSPHSSHHHPAAKRARRSLHRHREALLQQLHPLFPDMDPQLLEKALEESGDDLDSAIKRLNELRLESTEAILSSTGFKPENGHPAATHTSVEGFIFVFKDHYFPWMQLISNDRDIACPFKSTFTYPCHQAKDLMGHVAFHYLFQICINVLLKNSVVSLLVI